MKPSTWSLASALLAIAALSLSLAACGGGGEQTGGSDSYAADVPQAPSLPSMPDVPKPGPVPAPPGDGSDEPDEPGQVPDDPGVPPDQGDQTPLEPPASLPTWLDLQNVRAMTVDPDEGLLYAASSETGDLWRIPVDQEDARLAALLPQVGIRALAFDPAEKVIFAILQQALGEDNRLLRIDPAAFGAEAAPYDPTDLGPITGRQNIESLAFDAESRRLFAVDNEADILLSLDPATAEAIVVGELGTFGDIVGLAPDHQERRLLATDAEDRALAAIDLDSGVATLLADLGDRRVEGLASDAASEVLYGSTVSPPEVFAFDSLGRRYAFKDILGLAFDPADNKYFGVHTSSAQILKIDRQTEQRQVVGFVGIRGLEGLAYDASTRTLYAVSRLTQHLYTLSADDARVEATSPVHGAAAPFLGLAGLAFHDGALYASDSVSGSILLVEPDSGNAIVLGSPIDFPRIESLAFDGVANALHAFDNERRAYVVLRPSDANNPVLIRERGLEGIGGLGWAVDERLLVGTEIVADALVLVTSAPEPSPLGYERLAALAYRTDLEQMWAFDRATQTLLEIDPALKIGIPIATHEGVALEAMTFDVTDNRLFAVDADQGILYALPENGDLVPIGAPGALAPYRVMAIAHDATRQILYGVDAELDVLLAIDVATGHADVVNPGGPGLGFGTIEALHFDAATDALLGLDRATRALVAIDRDVGSAQELARVDAVEVGGLTMLPNSQIVWLANASYLVSVDRFDGGPVDPGPVLAQRETLSDEGASLHPLWPQGDVRRDALASCAVEVGAAHEGALDLELRCGDRVLHRSQLTPDGALARFQIPEPVRTALESGAAITWHVGDVSAAFRVVDGAAARAGVQKILAHPTVAARTDWERRLVEAFALDRAGLHSEALVVGIGTYETYPDRPTSARALLKTLERMGLVETRLGREVFLKALRP